MKNIIIFLLITITLFLLFEKFKKKENLYLMHQALPTPSSTPAATLSPTRPPTPSEQVEFTLSNMPIQASSLHEIYAKFPDLVRKQLKNRTIQITGNVQQIMLTGFSKNKAELIIGNFAQPKIVLVHDLNLHKDILTEINNEKTLVSWELNSPRLYLVKKLKPTGSYNYRGYRDQKTHVFTTGMNLSLECRLKEWNASSLYFYFEPNLDSEKQIINPERFPFQFLHW